MPNRTDHAHAIDWNETAKTFDRWLPYIQPVADALISLADISEGHKILDVASGTGEPSLTLARRFGGQIQIIGIDGAEAMVAIANGKARCERGAGRNIKLTFQQMKAEALAFQSDRFDRVISRFGVMLFDDQLAGIKEMRRVLKPKGKMAIAVWGEFHKIQSIYLIWKLLMKALPQEERLPIPKMADLGPPGRLEALLKEAGFDLVEMRPFRLIYAFNDFESYWTINTESGVLKEPLDKLTPLQQNRFKKEVMVALLSSQTEGKIMLENEAILALAIK
jgi:ubiquinone/menaquinone biosynthesis C-methylase UbiE